MKLRPKPTKKQKRQHLLLQVIKGNKISTQEDLKSMLKKYGMDVTQSSLSRDISDLGLTKQHGHYIIPPRHKQGATPIVTNIESAGPNLIVVKTLAGMAASVGILIDENKNPNIIGTVAGDDTVFVAIGPQSRHEKIAELIKDMFRSS